MGYVCAIIPIVSEYSAEITVCSAPFINWYWTILYLLPTKWIDWNKLHINETVPILVWQTSLHSFRYCSNSCEVCLSEVFIVSNAAWMFQTNGRLFNPFVKRCNTVCWTLCLACATNRGLLMFSDVLRHWCQNMGRERPLLEWLTV